MHDHLCTQTMPHKPVGSLSPPKHVRQQVREGLGNGGGRAGGGVVHDATPLRTDRPIAHSAPAVRGPYFALCVLWNLLWKTEHTRNGGQMSLVHKGSACGPGI